MSGPVILIPARLHDDRGKAAAVCATSALRLVLGCGVLGLGTGAGELFAVGVGGNVGVGAGDKTAGDGAVTSATGFSIAGAVDRTTSGDCLPLGAS
jgi:hypothetical protein